MKLSLNNSPMAHVIVSLNDFKIIDFNTKAFQMLNSTNSTAVLKSKLTDYCCQQSLNDLMHIKAILLRKSQVSQKELALMLPSNTVHVFLISGSILDAENQQHIAILSLSPIVGIKSRQSHMKYQHGYIKGIMDCCSDGIIVLNHYLKITDWNKTSKKIFGYSSQQITEKSFTLLLEKRSIKKFINSCKNIKNFNNSSSTDYYIIKNICGEFIPVKISLSLLDFEGASSLVLIVSDVTKEIADRNKLIMLSNNLKQSNSELESFCYVASHDLKEPISGIRNHTQIIQDGIKDSEHLTKQSIKIMDKCNYMFKLLDSLLEYSRVSSLTLDFQPLSIKKLLDNVINIIYYFINQNNADVLFSSEDFTIYADAVRMQEVFINLITNGIKYNNSDHPQVEITASSQRSSEFYIIKFKDNGIGIPTEKTDEIFNIFSRLKKTNASGTGAGLTITKRIINRHKGKIQVTSKEDCGSVFTIFIPKHNSAKGTEPIDDTKA